MDNLSFSGSSAEMQKQAIMKQIQQQAALQNAQQLIEKVNENCFAKCVPKPGPSLSSGETTCYKGCMEKYMAAWNTVSRSYIERIQQHGNSTLENS